MPTIASSELPVPKSWDEFEDICADLFSRIWGDRHTVRYGIQGGRQNGVDIRGQLPDGAVVGAQCKRKRQWPVAKLTTGDIDDEVAQAPKFKPALAAPMTPAQASRLKSLAKEACQPEQYAVGLSFDEAARRIDALKAEIALADSF